MDKFYNEFAGDSSKLSCRHINITSSNKHVVGYDEMCLIVAKIDINKFSVND